MTASGVPFPMGRAEDEGHLGRSFVAAPGSAVRSTMAQSRGLEASLTEIASNLKAVEELLTTLPPHARLAEPHVQELRETRAMVMALTVSRAQEGEGGITEGWDVPQTERHPGG